MSPLSGISRLSFDSLLFSKQSGSFCLVIFLLMVHSADILPENWQMFFGESGIFVWLLLSSWEVMVCR